MASTCARTLLWVLFAVRISGFQPFPLSSRIDSLYSAGGASTLRSNTVTADNAGHTGSNQTLSFFNSASSNPGKSTDTIDDLSDVGQQQQRVVHPPSTTPVIVILNRNARGVTQSTVDIAREVFGPAAVYVTTTALEADAAAAAIRRLAPRILVPVGGDGTLTAVLQSLCRIDMNTDGSLGSSSSCRSSSISTVEEAIQRLPIVAYIPLGTGNAVGSVVGCRVASSSWSSGWWPRQTKKQLQAVLQQIKDIAYAALEPNDNRPLIHTVALPILEVTTTQCSTAAGPYTQPKRALCFFAGVGFDSLMLNDFKAIKAWSVRTGILTNWLSSVTGYCVALVVKTLPQTIAKSSHKVRVRVTTRQANDTLWVDHRRGDFVQRVTLTRTDSSSTSERDSTTTLFEGETGILAAGTAPYYGGGLRLFPFARLTLDKMHLRLARIHPVTGFWHIPSIFAGSYRDKSDRFGVLDYIGSEFDVQILREDNGNDKHDHSNMGFPFQHSGESVGNVDGFRLRVVKEPIQFLSLLKER